MMPRRSKTLILVDILRLMQRKNGKVKPTHILYGANLSHKRMKKYLALLLENGFIEEVEERGRKYYKITDKGYAFIIEFRKVEKLSEAFGIPI